MKVFGKIFLFAIFILGVAKCFFVFGEDIYDFKPSGFAGSFYPMEKNSLDKMIEGYLEDAKTVRLKEGEKAIGFISPHAGYVYSGNVAAWVYKQFINQEIDLIVIFGNSHHYYYEGASLGFFKNYETPLGILGVDFHIIKRLLKRKSNILHFYPKAHLSDHCIEVQVPFIQKVKKNVKILPVLFGNGSFENVRKVVDIIWTEIENTNVVFVASTDLSHYHSYNEAVKIDKNTIEIISELDTSLFEKNYKTKKIELCGSCAVYALIYVAEKKQNCRFSVLKYANSGDVPNGNKKCVVGYLAGMITTISNDE